MLANIFAVQFRELTSPRGTGQSLSASRVPPDQARFKKPTQVSGLACTDPFVPARASGTRLFENFRHHHIRSVGARSVARSSDRVPAGLLRAVLLACADNSDFRSLRIPCHDRSLVCSVALSAR
jgi:hypothetical protein